MSRSPTIPGGRKRRCTIAPAKVRVVSRLAEPATRPGYFRVQYPGGRQVFEIPEAVWNDGTPA